MVFKFRKVNLVLLTFFFFLSTYQALASDVDLYWQKLSANKPEKIKLIYQKRALIEQSGAGTDFFNKSLDYFLSLNSQPSWSLDIVSDLLTKAGPQYLDGEDFKNSFKIFLDFYLSEGKVITLKKFLDWQIANNPNFKKKPKLHLYFLMKSAEIHLILQDVEQAEKIFLQAETDCSEYMGFWELYSYVEVLVNLGKVEEAQKKLQQVISNKSIDSSKKDRWVLILESKILLRQKKYNEALIKIQESKKAFLKESDSARKNSYVNYNLSIIARRDQKAKISKEAAETALSGLAETKDRTTIFWYRMNILKNNLFFSLGGNNKKLLEDAFSQVKNTEIEEIYKTYYDLYSKLISGNLREENVKSILSKKENYFETDELTFLVRQKRN